MAKAVPAASTPRLVRLNHRSGWSVCGLMVAWQRALVLSPAPRPTEEKQTNKSKNYIFSSGYHPPFFPNFSHGKVRRTAGHKPQMRHPVLFTAE